MPPGCFSSGLRFPFLLPPPASSFLSLFGRAEVVLSVSASLSRRQVRGRMRVLYRPPCRLDFISTAAAISVWILPGCLFSVVTWYVPFWQKGKAGGLLLMVWEGVCVPRGGKTSPLDDAFAPQFIRGEQNEFHQQWLTRMEANRNLVFS